MSDYLPWDIITEILSRLPVRSLMRFKSVSRSFYNLVSFDHEFKRKHLRRSSNLKRAILHPVCKTREPIAFSCSLSALSSDGPFSDAVTELEFPVMVPRPLHMFLYFYNSCDGLFCVGQREGGVTIWNPSTKEVQRLPSCLIGDEKTYTTRRVSYWIAYDSLSYVYKVLGLVKYRDLSDVTFDFWLYSMKAGSSWRKVEDYLPCGYIIYFDSCNLVNGAFHWLGYISVGVGPVCIVSLDITKEKFRKCELPQAILDSKYQNLCLSMGKLSVFCQRSEVCYDIWVMKEYGVAESVTRILSISLSQFHKRLCMPLYMFEDNTIILYVVGENEPERIGIYKDGRFLCNITVGNFEITMAYVYSESLISPHINNQRPLSTSYE